MAGIVRTVLGDRDPAGFRRIAIHEHLLYDIVAPDRRGDPETPLSMATRWQVDYRSNENPANARQTDRALAASELAAFADDGGDLIVDQSVHGLARDAEGLAAAARSSGVAVVASAGTYTEPYLDRATATLDADALAMRFIGEIESGLDGTAIRAGLIGEIGCSWPLAPIERRALVAAARAQRATGAAISVHPGRDARAPFEIVDLLGGAGADLARVVICHMDRTYPEGEGPAALAATGVCVEWDFFGIETSHYWMGDLELPTDRGRLRAIRRMFDAGMGERVLVSQDICTATRCLGWGGQGYGHLFRNGEPLMRGMGFGEAEIDALLRANPLRLLTLPCEGAA